MAHSLHYTVFGLLLLVGCNSDPGPPSVKPPSSAAVTNSFAAAAPKIPPARVSAKEDDGSPQAAGALVIYYYALLSAGDFVEASTLWRDKPKPSVLADGLKGVGGLKADIGSVADAEGAAGSLYIEIPVVVSGLRDGQPFALKRRVTVRRVNDVPGSSAADRRWHIASIAGGTNKVGGADLL